MGTKKKAVASDFLFSRPSPLFGVARFFDFSGTFDEYNESASGDEADAKAMYADWCAVGESFRSSISDLEAEQESEKAA